MQVRAEIACLLCKKASGFVATPEISVWKQYNSVSSQWICRDCLAQHGFWRSETQFLDLLDEELVPQLLSQYLGLSEYRKLILLNKRCKEALGNAKVSWVAYRCLFPAQFDDDPKLSTLQHPSQAVPLFPKCITFPAKWTGTWHDDPRFWALQPGGDQLLHSTGHQVWQVQHGLCWFEHRCLIAAPQTPGFYGVFFRVNLACHTEMSGDRRAYILEIELRKAEGKSAAIGDVKRFYKIGANPPSLVDDSGENSWESERTVAVGRRYLTLEQINAIKSAGPVYHDLFFGNIYFSCEAPAEEYEVLLSYRNIGSSCGRHGGLYDLAFFWPLKDTEGAFDVSQNSNGVLINHGLSEVLQDSDILRLPSTPSETCQDDVFKGAAHDFHSVRIPRLFRRFRGRC